MAQVSYSMYFTFMKVYGKDVGMAVGSVQGSQSIPHAFMEDRHWFKMVRVT
jgi:hypothetical protein